MRVLDWIIVQTVLFIKCIANLNAYFSTAEKVMNEKLSRFRN